MNRVPQPLIGYPKNGRVRGSARVLLNYSVADLKAALGAAISSIGHHCWRLPRSSQPNVT